MAGPELNKIKLLHGLMTHPVYVQNHVFSSHSQETKNLQFDRGGHD
jgi:hypothetical protein